MLRSNSASLDRLGSPLVAFTDTWEQQRTREVAMGAALSGKLQAQSTDTGHDMVGHSLAKPLLAAPESNIKVLASGNCRLHWQLYVG